MKCKLSLSIICVHQLCGFVAMGLKARSYTSITPFNIVKSFGQGVSLSLTLLKLIYSRIHGHMYSLSNRDLNFIS